MARCYIRNGVLGWSPDDQERALVEAGVLDAQHLYRDILPAGRIKQIGRIKGDWLVHRNKDLLRPAGASQPEIIAVATWPALGVSPADLSRALERAWARGATVMAVDSGLSLPPSAGIAGANMAMEAWAKAQQAARTKPGRAAGSLAAAAKKRARSSAAAKLARAQWQSTAPDRPSAIEIAESVGVSVPTLYRLLRERPRKRQERSA